MRTILLGADRDVCFDVACCCREDSPQIHHGENVLCAVFGDESLREEAEGGKFGLYSKGRGIRMRVCRYHGTISPTNVECNEAFFTARRYGG